MKDFEIFQSFGVAVSVRVDEYVAERRSVNASGALFSHVADGRWVFGVLLSFPKLTATPCVSGWH